MRGEKGKWGEMEEREGERSRIERGMKKAVSLLFIYIRPMVHVKPKMVTV